MHSLPKLKDKTKTNNLLYNQANETSLRYAAEHKTKDKNDHDAQPAKT